VQLSLWVEPYFPADLVRQISAESGLPLATEAGEADIQLGINATQPLARWVYALVAPFPTVSQGVTSAELQAAWEGRLVDSPFAGLPLLMDENTLGIFAEFWGSPADGAVQVVPAGQLLDTAWKSQPAWGIVSFESLEPRWKVLQVDGSSPLQQDFTPANYPLVIPLGVTRGELLAGENYPIITNRDPQKMTTVMLTGVTALVRATAETMRRYGMTYPAQDIGPWLRTTDILHVNNEVPFDPSCPNPDLTTQELVFCSRPEYLELLLDIGTDVVELSGDHFADRGPEAMRYTLDLYRENGIPYYGGGSTEEEARQPLLLEHNGNRIAFLGCNAKGGGYATARGDQPGAVACDYEYLAGEIDRLRAEGYLVIVTLQHFEYYTFEPQPRLVESFRFLAENGATIVSGSQAHQPHGMEFYAGSFLHYGLGNLFFDQYHFDLPTDSALLDRHVIYAGRHISTELLGIKFVDFARSRPMTDKEFRELLEQVFAASLW
jgi:poly-gamma-glutamate synthesis protein (capsule biosynthesis protein)